jgi:hypothetical protein
MWRKSLRETNSAATVTRFEFSWEIGRESKVKQCSCGSPTGEFAPVKVKNEFVGG